MEDKRRMDGYVDMSERVFTQALRGDKGTD